MANALKMPKLGQEMTEGRVAEWFKDVGDEIRAGEVVALIETDKTMVDLESPVDGYIGAFPVGTGDSVDVGTVIAWVLETPDEAVPGSPMEEPEPKTEPTVESSAGLRSAERAPSLGSSSTREAATPASRVPASPRARRMAERLGIDLASIAPTGPQGWVTAHDVQAASDAAGSRTAVTSMRRAIAGQMTRSALVPQFRVAREVDVTELAGHLAGQDATFTDAAVWAAARALTRHPEVNASWQEGPPPAIERHRRVVVGLAVSVPEGLIVPVVADAAQGSLAEIHGRRRELEARARAGTLRSAQLQGATFSVSSLGSLGVDHFDALVNPPEAGILAVGAVAERAVVRDGAVVVRMTVMLSFAGDHRVLDGATGAKFLATTAEMLDRLASEHRR